MGELMCLLQADARVLPLADATVQCVVTSPPYWGLRDYGTAQWSGGDAACDHRQETKHQAQGATSARSGRANVEFQRNQNVRNVCPKCGASRIDQQLGLEPTPDAYVANLVSVFREVWRVLKDDGVVWLNLGDSYLTKPMGWGSTHDPKYAGGRNRRGAHPSSNRTNDPASLGLKHKDLIGIPWRVAFALQADGWYLRSDIIWAKPNTMPESVTDRPTKAHEYLFLLTKAERYYYDADAISELVSAAMLVEVEQGYDGLGLKDYEGAGVQNPSSVKARIIANARTRAEKKRGQRYDNTGNVGMDDRWSKERRAEILTRNKRSVWTVNTQPYRDAHFATFPEKLVEPCILAGSKPDDLVLDPFCGSGTVGVVGARYGRRFVGCDLNPAYLVMARERLATVQPCLPWAS